MEHLVGIVIRVPAAAVVPIIIGGGVLLVLLFAGAGLASWKERSPQSAKIVGTIMALAATGYAGYMLFQVFPQNDENDPVYNGVHLVTFLDAPMIAFIGAVAAILWAWAGQRWVGVGVGAVVALLLLVKPFAFPLQRHWDGNIRTRHLGDLEHLAFLGTGIVVAIVTLVIWRRRPA